MTTTILRPLTKRQASIWRFIRDHHSRHRHGCCVRDICRKFGIKSPHGAACAVEVLINKGWVEWPGKRGKYRLAHCIMPSVDSLEVTDGEA